MAQITINEISQNYTYNIGSNSYCTVALPITSCWGPGYFDPEANYSGDVELALENAVWQRFPATQEGLEAFVSAYRGPAANYRLAKDFSYQMAMTLLTAGYDVLVCRLSPGAIAKNIISTDNGQAGLTVSAKYPGTFGNSIMVKLNKVPNRNYQNLIVYILDSTGIKTAVENLIFAFDINNSDDNIPHISEIESKFIDLSVMGVITDDVNFKEAEIYENVDDPNKIVRQKLSDGVTLFDGSDRAAESDADQMLAEAVTLAKARYAVVDEDAGSVEYLNELSIVKSDDTSKASILRYREWLYTHLVGTDKKNGGVYDLLKDKLAYNPNRVISPGWDDQDILFINPEYPVEKWETISPIHIKLMDVAYYSRCATGMIDIPKSMPRKFVHNESESTSEQGYAQLLARYVPSNATLDLNVSLYHTHSALFAPWGQYKYVGTGKQNPASPSFQALLIQRAMILNQSLQYEWALPTNRKHNLALGKLDYPVPKKLLDQWQKLDGVGVNVITAIPDLGTGLWGNSTLYEVPPATYQALANLSTRYLVNAVENIAYKVGVSITFQYNNDEAYSRFYAGVTPILDTMKNVGAIDGYYVKMAADINGLDQVNANTVIGKVYLVINGVINDIVIDLIALPPGTDLNQFQA